MTHRRSARRVLVALASIAVVVAGQATAQVSAPPETTPSTSSSTIPSTTLAPPSRIPTAVAPAPAGPRVGAIPSTAATSPPATAGALPSTPAVAPAAKPAATPPAATTNATTNQPLASISKSTTTTPPAATQPNVVAPVSPSGSRVPTTLTSNFTSNNASVPSTADAASEVRNSVRVSKGAGTLPNEHGQVWREYDISPYTSRIKGVDKPETAIIDWILRETGTDAWFSQPLGVLSADSNTLRVYHTPEVQTLVRDTVERFFSTSVAERTLVVRVVTLNSPGWRSKALSLLKPIDVKSPGIDGWLLSREDAAVLLGDLRRRADYREQGSPMLQTITGQTEEVARTRPRAYPRTIRLRPDVWPGYETIVGQIDEGFQLQLSPLPTLDGKSMELAVKCNIDQIERLVPVSFEVPISNQTQRAEVQVPQLVSWRLNERLRWPVDQVLVLSCGVVASPGPESAAVLPFLKALNPSDRADALLIVEVKDGPASAHATAPAATAAAASAQPSHVLPIQPIPLQQSGRTATRQSPTPWRY